MVLTRAEGKVALTHTLKNVLKLEDDNPLFRALSKEDLLDITDVLILPFEDIEKLTYLDDQGDKRNLVRRYTFALHLLKSYFLHRQAQGNPIGDNWTGITHEDVHNYRVGPDYTLVSVSHPPTALASLATSQCFRDPIADFKKSVKRDSSVPPVPKDDAIVVHIGEASPVSKGMKKTTESPKEDLVASMDTSKFVSPTSQPDDTWQSIARDSMSYWDTVAREATLHWREKDGLLKKDPIVTDHVADSLPHVMLPDAVNFVDEMHIFEVPSPVLNTAISSFIPIVMPPLPNLLSNPRRKSSSIAEQETYSVVLYI
jgi:hypothetical protein